MRNWQSSERNLSGFREMVGSAVAVHSQVSQRTVSQRPSHRHRLAPMLIALLAAGCAGPSNAWVKVSDGPLVGPEAGGGMGMTNSLAEPNVSYAVDSLGFCTEAEGVELRRVTPVKTTGPLKLERVGVRAMTEGRQMLEAGKPLPADFGPIEGFRKVTSCAANEWTEVGVQLSRTGPGEARVEHFIVEYRQGNKSYREQWPVTITLCDQDADSVSEDCRVQ